jgi:prepilin-type N-terminal cleavage/methylation domain-containing protein
MKKARNNKGFTLVELMVVAIIVAILAAVAIPLMSANKRRAIATEAEAGCGSIRTAMRIHYAEFAAYPASTANVTNLVGIGSGDLDGTYFSEGDYSIANPGVSGGGSLYDINATGTGDTAAPKAAAALGISVTLNSDGEWERSGL